MKIKKILVPTDFSEESISAYTHAQELAKKYGAKVDMIHIVPTLKYFSESFSKLGVPLDVDEDLYPHLKDGAKHKMGGFMDDYLEKEYRGDAIVKIERKPWKGIIDYAAENDYSLIVMAARGKHSSDLLKGSITEKIIRHSRVPVFTVDNRLNPEGLKRILVPTDSSPVSFACFPLALTLAETYGAEITLFHVLELHGTISESEEREPGKTEEASIYEHIIDHLNDYLVDQDLGEVLIQRTDEPFVDKVVITKNEAQLTIPLKTVIEKGVSAHYEIERYAPEHSDVVVMTTHGHSGLAHFFLGSTAEKVAQRVDMPVVTVKPAENRLSAD